MAGITRDWTGAWTPANSRAELPDADADAPVPSPSPEKAKESLDNLGHLGDSRMEDDEKVSESRKSDAPSPIAGMTPGGDSPGGDSSRDAGAEGAEGGADDKSSPVAIRTNPGDRNRQMFETSIAERRGGARRRSAAGDCGQSRQDVEARRRTAKEERRTGSRRDERKHEHGSVAADAAVAEVARGDLAGGRSRAAGAAAPARV